MCVCFNLSPYLIWAAVGGEGSTSSENKKKAKRKSEFHSLTAEV